MTRPKLSRRARWLAGIVAAWVLLSAIYGPRQMPKDLLWGIWSLPLVFAHVSYAPDRIIATADMAALASALEAYHQDWDALPGEVPMVLLAADPAWVRANGEASRTTLDIARLTTPVAYLADASILGDHHTARIVPRLFHKGRWFTSGRSETARAPLAYRTDGQRWIIVSRGPNLRFDAPDPLALVELGPDGTTWPTAELFHLAHDPTNGTLSGGDQFRNWW